MKELNLKRILDGFYVYNNKSYKEQEAIYDYILELDVDLNTANVDDIIVNGMAYMTKQEAEENNVYIICHLVDDEVLALSY